MKIVLIILGIWLLFTIVAVAMAFNKMKHFNNYKELYKGMSENEMLKLMGNGFTKEELPKYIRYTWTMSSRMQGAHQVVVDVVNGEVKNFRVNK